MDSRARYKVKMSRKRIGEIRLMNELIINGIDWLNPKLIGLKVIVSEPNEIDEYAVEHVGTLDLVNSESLFPFMIREKAVSYKQCRLSQGEE